jgi:hypothetical protein
MIYIIGAVIAFFFELLLISKKNKNLADKILTIWMFVIGVHLFLYYIQSSDFAMDYPVIYGIVGPIPLLHGPLLLLYTQALTGSLTKMEWKSYLHFLIVAAYYFYNFKFFFVFDDRERTVYVNQIFDGHLPVDYVILFTMQIIQPIIYHIFTFVLYLHHARNIKKHFSYNNERINLHWLRNLVLGMTVIWTTVFLNAILPHFEFFGELIYIWVVLFVFAIGFFGIRQGSIFVSQQPALSGKLIANSNIRSPILNEKKTLCKIRLKGTTGRKNSCRT